MQKSQAPAQNWSMCTFLHYFDQNNPGNEFITVQQLQYVRICISAHALPPTVPLPHCSIYKSHFQLPLMARCTRAFVDKLKETEPTSEVK